jgi:hypothetical protein
VKAASEGDSETAAALRAEREAVNAEAIAHTEEFQLDPPVKLSDSRSKKNRAAVSQNVANAYAYALFLKLALLFTYF